MDRLAEEVSIESEYIRQTLDMIRDAKERPQLTLIELSSIGAGLHHCYNGMENILKRILKHRGVTITPSHSSHKDLLDIAVQENVISSALSSKPDKFRGFRHFFSHGYGIHLKAEYLLPLAEEIPMVCFDFFKEIQAAIKLP